MLILIESGTEGGVVGNDLHVGSLIILMVVGAYTLSTAVRWCDQGCWGFPLTLKALSSLQA